MTRQALLSAIVVDLAIGGSTNCALHLPAFARALEIELALCNFPGASINSFPQKNCLQLWGLKISFFTLNKNFN